MKILFLGTPRFAEIVFQKLIDENFEISGLVCRSDKIAGRGNKVVTPKIVSIAKEHNIPLIEIPFTCNTYEKEVKFLKQYN